VTANNRWRGKNDEDAEGLGGRLGLTRKRVKGDDAPGSGCLLIFIPFLALGAIALAIGAKELYDQHTFRSVAIHATGEVIGHDSSAGSRGQQFHPIVRCKAANGETFQFRCRYAYPKEEYPLGQAVDVLYDPADPTRAEVDSNQSRYRVYFLPGFGVFLWLFSLAGAAIGRKLLARARPRTET
jgi:hypothetical protein